MGMSGEAMVAALQEASQGLLSNDAIVAGANRAMLTMGEQIASKLPDLMRISILASRELGMSQDEMWNTIIMAISRASPRMLTSMGMLLDIGDDYEIAAQKIGKTAAELTALEQRQILGNAVMGWGATTFGDITQKGEEVVIVRRGKRIARLVAVGDTDKRLPDLRTFRNSISLKGEALSRAVIQGRSEERY